MMVDSGAPTMAVTKDLIVFPLSSLGFDVLISRMQL
jgi:hypothetical protein